MYDYTSNNWSHWNSNKKLKEQFGSCTRKTFDRFTTKDSYTWNITQYGKYCSVKLEAWAVGITAGSREVPGRNACDRRHHIENNCNNMTLQIFQYWRLLASIWKLLSVQKDHTIMKETDILQDKQYMYKCNNEPRSRNHCCHTKAISTTYSECVSVTLFTKHAEHKRLFISPVASLAVQCSSTLSYKPNEFRGKIYWT